MSVEEIKKTEKQFEATRGESTRRMPSFIPPVDVYEDKSSITVVADMPGVNKNGVSIDIKDDQLKILGKVEASAPHETALRREYETGNYYRQFTIAAELIDLDKITAKMADGVLTLTLPKAEKAVPLRIEVTSE